MNYRLKHRIGRNHIYSVFLFLLCSCAQVVSPGGGPKDQTPPKALKYRPDSAAINFKANSIEIIFDEYFQLKDLNNQLIVSPPLEKTPDIKVKNNSLIIELDKAEILKPNTTYCISFGNAIQDINESNPKENFRYIFSTGTFIDSLKVKGKVENAFDKKTEKGILVMLYSNYNDSSVYNQLPDYFNKTNPDGRFEIGNVREGNYTMIALKDGNANYKYDEGESIGFTHEGIDTKTTQNIQIRLFQEPVKKLFLKKHLHNSFGKIMFVFNKPADSISIQPVNQKFEENDIILEYSETGDTLNYWLKHYDKDSLTLEVKNGSRVLDTIEFRLTDKESALKNNRNPLRFELVRSPNANNNFDLNSEIKLLFNHPIDSIKEIKNIQFKEDTLLYKTSDYLTFKKHEISGIKFGYWDSTEFIEDANFPGELLSAPLFRSPKLKENTSYQLLIPSGTFTDIFGLKNDTLKINFKTREEKFYGTVKLKINPLVQEDSIKKHQVNYIVQLLDEKENVKRQSNIKGENIIEYQYLYPQKYTLKIIVDENNNGIWDSGNFSEKTLPESVIYYSEPLLIRSNWDLDMEWNVKE